jgi:hypothetical protein
MLGRTNIVSNARVVAMLITTHHIDSSAHLLHVTTLSEVFKCIVLLR